MTDNEIIKALECCYTTGTSCEECPMYNFDECNDVLMAKYVRDLIKRQQAEIEKLRKNDFDNLDFSKCSIDEKYWALLLLAVATCKDMEFLKIIRDKFLVGLDNAHTKGEDD